MVRERSPSYSYDGSQGWFIILTVIHPRYFGGYFINDWRCMLADSLMPTLTITKYLSILSRPY